MSLERTDVLIIGGGPAGLVTAIDLGRRGVPCIVLEEDAGPPTFPKANSTTSRTMEHYRRLGVVNDIRPLGLPSDYPPSISYHTRLCGDEIARLRWPSRDEALATRQKPDPRWPTPEPMHRAQQMLIEPVLARHAAAYPSVDIRFGWRMTRITESEEKVEVEAVDIATGRSQSFVSHYAVGCDGPRSAVREAIGTRLEGIGSEDREFLGGRMLATYIRAPEFYRALPLERSWMYWILNRERHGVLTAIDGEGLFVFHTQLRPGVTGSVAFADESFRKVLGGEIPFEILGAVEWTAGFTLVGSRFSSGRIFLAGDAAHLFTPTSGLGYNTSVDDASNLAWKLAAMRHGWGGPRLLASYEAERKPIAIRNTQFARQIAEFFRKLGLPEHLEDDTPEGERDRLDFGARLQAFASEEFDTPGIHFGVFYGQSSLIVAEPGPPPPDDAHWYEPHARPGARAPHFWLAPDRALYDEFGMDFTLVRFDPALNVDALVREAQRLGAPLKVIDVDHPEARQVYAADLALVRPDQHIAWRGARLPEDVGALMRIVTGWSEERVAPDRLTVVRA